MFESILESHTVNPNTRGAIRPGGVPDSGIINTLIAKVDRIRHRDKIKSPRFKNGLETSPYTHTSDKKSIVNKTIDEIESETNAIIASKENTLKYLTFLRSKAEEISQKKQEDSPIIGLDQVTTTWKMYDGKTKEVNLYAFSMYAPKLSGKLSILTQIPEHLLENLLHAVQKTDFVEMSILSTASPQKFSIKLNDQVQLIGLRDEPDGTVLTLYLEKTKTG